MHPVLLHCLRLSLPPLLMAGCAQPQEIVQQQQSPIKPVASVLDIMESLIAHMADDIFKSVGTIIDETGQHEIVPQNDEAWMELRFAARSMVKAPSGWMGGLRAIGMPLTK